MKVKDLFWVLVLGASALYGYDRYQTHQSQKAELQAAPPTRQAPETTVADDRSWIKPRESTPAATQPASQFKCDGRTHCSQMRSCAEAEFFLKNCPNTQMDGNNDGEPCEQQWCN